MASGARSLMHLDALDAAVAAYGRCADPSTAMAPSEWQRFPASGGERASGCNAVRHRLPWSRRFPFEMGESTREAGSQSRQQVALYE